MNIFFVFTREIFIGRPSSIPSGKRQGRNFYKLVFFPWKKGLKPSSTVTFFVLNIFCKALSGETIASCDCRRS